MGGLCGATRLGQVYPAAVWAADALLESGLLQCTPGLDAGTVAPALAAALEPVTEAPIERFMEAHEADWILLADGEVHNGARDIARGIQGCLAVQVNRVRL